MSQPLRILLVDDDEITNFLSSEVLQFHFENAEISVVMNGEEAMQHLFGQLKLNAPLPHVMLVDINMPYMDGWEFLEILEDTNKDEFSAIAIFMYTSSVYFEDIDRGKNNSLLKNILTKPLDEISINQIREAIPSKIVV
ncbi:MAG: response regulator [Chitinophagaceae bacterium]|nr:response regulator [Chitinophagaceae bacterium]